MQVNLKRLYIGIYRWFAYVKYTSCAVQIYFTRRASILQQSGHCNGLAETAHY